MIVERTVEQGAGHTAEAALAWEQVLRLTPGDSAALEELRRLREKPA
jgi:predicted TPR repeat methyltransferase